MDPTGSTRSRARVGVSVAFLVHAVVLGSWAPRIPDITDRLGIGPAELGLALTGLAVAFVVGARLAAWPMARAGSAVVVRVCVPAVALALVGPAIAGDLAFLTASLAALGLIGGLLDVAMNHQAVLVERAYGRPIMSAFHALWSVGSMAGALGAVAAVQAGAGVQAHLAATAIVLIGGSWPLLRGGLIEEPRGATDRGAPVRRGWFVSRAVLLLGLIGFSSFVAEGSAADWSALYLRDVAGASAAVASAGFAAFEAGMAAVRFTADRLTTRFGPVLMVRAGGALAACGLGLALAADAPALVLVGLAGFGAGLGPVVPTVFSAAGNLREGASGAALSEVVAVSYVGAILGPIAVGFTADHVGLRWALLIPAGLTLVIVIGAGAVSTAAGAVNARSSRAEPAA